MHSRECKSIIIKMARTFVLLAVLATLFGTVAGDAIAALHSDDCEHHSEQDCNNCGDCIHCLPSLFMIAVDISAEQPKDIPAVYNKLCCSIGRPTGTPGRIDHPPRI
ncbi:MAG: hypothetical protein R3F48_00575 [Candidatus Zixiibacteriota bacterium]